MLVQCAASGRAGIDSARAADVDVIITNLGPPDIHGLDLAGHLLRSSTRRNA